MKKQGKEIVINIILTEKDDVTIILTQEDKKIIEFLNQYESEEEKASILRMLLRIGIAREIQKQEQESIDKFKKHQEMIPHTLCELFMLSK